ncbi:MAG: hypothetical protein HQ488_04730 [Parcubacteria group bacterium]|nr:hypothetical protein [Parcubacteria group bacterium]
MDFTSLHPFVQSLLTEFIRDGFSGHIIACYPWPDPNATAPERPHLKELATPPEEASQHIDLTLTFRGTPCYFMSDLEVILTSPWILDLDQFYAIISNKTAEHLFDGAIRHHTIVLYPKRCGNGLVLSRFGHFSPT